MEPRLDLTKEYGLVLEGGGAKGAYQIGAWKALKEAGVKIKGVSGTSVGALNGALICMDDLERAENLWANISYSQIINVDDELMGMGKGSVSGVGTGGMATKLIAAELATSAGADMVIANGRDMNVIHKIIDGQPYGTFFCSNEDEAFELKRFLKEHFYE